MTIVRIEDLLNEVKPVLTFTLGDKEYPVYSQKHMSEAQNMRVLQCNVNLRVEDENFARTKANLKSEIIACYDPSGGVVNREKDLFAIDDNGSEVKIAKGKEETYNKLVAQQIIEESKLTAPMRQLVEAMAGMEEGALSEYPPSVSMQLLSQINTALKETEIQDSGAEPAPKQEVQKPATLAPPVSQPS